MCEIFTKRYPEFIVLLLITRYSENYYLLFLMDLFERNEVENFYDHPADMTIDAAYRILTLEDGSHHLTVSTKIDSPEGFADNRL